MFNEFKNGEYQLKGQVYDGDNVQDIVRYEYCKGIAPILKSGKIQLIRQYNDNVKGVSGNILQQGKTETW